VINPQNGHILCNRTSGSRGRNLASNVVKNSRAEASRWRKEGRYSSIDFTLRVLGRLANLQQPNDDRETQAILCRIAHMRSILQLAVTGKPIIPVEGLEVSN
jgi:hypothetical protein